MLSVLHLRPSRTSLDSAIVGLELGMSPAMAVTTQWAGKQRHSANALEYVAKAVLSRSLSTIFLRDVP